MTTENTTTVENNGATGTETGRRAGRVKPKSPWGTLYALAGKMATRATSLKRVTDEGTVSVRLAGFPSGYKADALAGLAHRDGIKGTMVPVDDNGDPVRVGETTLRHTFAAEGEAADAFVRAMLAK
jgi:hypothetical protein